MLPRMLQLCDFPVALFVCGCIVAQEWSIWKTLLFCSNLCSTCLDWEVHRCRCFHIGYRLILISPQLSAVTWTAVVLTFICTGGYEMVSSLTEHEVWLMLRSCGLTCWSQHVFSCIHKLYSDTAFNSHSSILLVLLFPLPGMNIDAHVHLGCCPRPIFSRASLLPASGFAFCYWTTEGCQSNWGNCGIDLRYPLLGKSSLCIHWFLVLGIEYAGQLDYKRDVYWSEPGKILLPSVCSPAGSNWLAAFAYSNLFVFLLLSRWWKHSETSSSTTQQAEKYIWFGERGGVNASAAGCRTAGKWNGAEECRKPCMTQAWETGVRHGGRPIRCTF